jgi:hypothetical protein
MDRDGNEGVPMTVKKICFRTRLLQTGKTTTGIEIPPDVIVALNAGARPAVVANVNDYVYRTTVGVMGGRSLLPFSADHRLASGLQGGDPIEVGLALDQAPRTVEIPADLDRALSSRTGLRAAFMKQAPSRQKADVDHVLGAKAAETRSRRIDAIIAKLRA